MSFKLYKLKVSGTEERNNIMFTEPKGLIVSLKFQYNLKFNFFLIFIDLILFFDT